jgi:hypothetical protein
MPYAGPTGRALTAREMTDRVGHKSTLYQQNRLRALPGPRCTERHLSTAHIPHPLRRPSSLAVSGRNLDTRAGAAPWLGEISRCGHRHGEENSQHNKDGNRVDQRHEQVDAGEILVVCAMRAAPSSRSPGLLRRTSPSTQRNCTAPATWAKV